MGVELLGDAAALATSICWSAAAVIFAQLGKEFGSSVVVRGRMGLALVFLLFTHVAVEGRLLPHASTDVWFWLSVSGFCSMVVGDTLYYYAMATIGPRVSTLVVSSVPVFGAMFGWLIFSEVPALRDWTGIFLTVAGIGLVVFTTRGQLIGRERSDFLPGVCCALGGAAGRLGGLLAAKVVLSTGISALSATTIRTLVACIFLWGAAGITSKHGGARALCKDRTALLLIVTGSLIGPFIGMWLSIVALELTPIGVASTLMALPTILIAIYEWLFLRKSIGIVALLGTVVSLVGVVLLVLK